MIAVLSFAFAAFAKDVPLAIALDHAPGEVPSQVCVALLGIKGDATVDLDAYAEATATPTTSVVQRDGGQIARFELKADRLRGVPLATSDEGLDHPARAAHYAAHRALAQLVGPPSAGECSAPEACTPRLEVPVQYLATDDGGSKQLGTRIGCTRNVRSQQGDDGRERVLVLYVDFAKANDVKPALKRLHLDGSIVRMDFATRTAGGDGWMVIAGVGGGHYAATGATVLAAGGRMTLPVALQCRRHAVQLPPVLAGSATAATVTFRAGNAPASTCTATVDADARIEVALPFAASMGEKHLSVRTGAGPDDPRYSVSDTRWTAPRAPPVLHTAARDVAFAWDRHCLWPEPATVACERRLPALIGGGPALAQTDPAPRCPRASLPRAGASCVVVDSPDHATCRYRCGASEGEGGGAGLRFQLPTPVQFDREGLERWTDTLDYVGERLTGYVPAAERVLGAAFVCWDEVDLSPDRSHAGDAIRELRVRAPDGQFVAVVPKVEGNRRLRLAGVTCGDQLSYQIVGQRRHRAGTARVVGGRVVFEAPAITARLYGMSVGVGTAVLLPGYRAEHGDRGWKEEIGFTSSFAMWFRPARLGFRLFGVDRVPWFEWLQLNYLLSPQQYLPLQSNEIDPLATEQVLYNRISLSTAAFLHLSHRISGGIGGGVVWGFPTFADAGAVGDLKIDWTAAVEGRFSPNDRHVQLTSAIRYLPDRLYVFQTDFASGVSERVLRGQKVIVEIGVRFGT